jgi:DnaJ-class molecular chaperone
MLTSGVFRRVVPGNFHAPIIRHFTTIDPYRVLGLSPSASADEAKQAYRKLAMKWHPDKNPTNRAEAEKKFKEVSEAYRMIQEGAQPGRAGPAGAAGAGPGGAGFPGGPHVRHMDMREAEEIFRHMFRGFGDIFGGAAGFPGSAAPGGSRAGGSSTSTSQEVVTKNGKRFLRRTTVTSRPDGSSRTEIDETPI